METIIFKTLIHSLWQGVLLAVITAFVLILTNKSSAKLRYNWLMSLLVVFALGIGLSFAYELQQQQHIKTTVSLFSPLSATPTVQTINIVSGLGQPVNLFSQGLQYFSDYSAIIVLIWFLVICAKSVQLFAGLYGVKRIRETKVYDAGEYWENRVNELALHFGIKQVVSIVQSGIAKVPMVVGHFKPLILIPLGLINGLSEKEVEAILCHELAHVKRRDYLANILQSFMEVVFFFNPAVLWISKLIREERENCCDDLAISATSNKASYISALISCQEFQMSVPQYAMAISGNNDHLVDRVKRMVSNERPALNKIQKGILAVGLVAALTLTFAFTGSIETTKLNGPFALSAKDSLKIKGKAKRTKTTTVKVDGVVLYDKQEITYIDKAQLEKEERENEARDRARIAADKRRIEDDEKRVLADQRRAQDDQKRAQEEQRRAQHDAQRRAEDAKRNAADNERAAAHASQRARDAVNSAAQDRITASLKKGNDEKAKATSVKTTATARTVFKGDLYPNGVRFSSEDGKELIEQLIKDKLINANSDLSYRLNATDFEVNGKKMSKQIQQKYRNRYIKSPEWVVSYNSSSTESKSEN